MSILDIKAIFIFCEENQNWKCRIKFKNGSKKEKCELTDGLQSAWGERVSNIAFVTGAGRDVINDFALGIDATQAGAGIHTLQPLACFVWWTISIDGALWSAGHIWVSKVILNTLAGCSSISVGAKGIGSTRWWVAGVGSLGYLGWSWNKKSINTTKKIFFTKDFNIHQLLL